MSAPPPGNQPQYPAQYPSQYPTQYPGPYGPGAQIARPKPTSTAGPRATVVVGVGTLLLAIVAGVLGARAFVDILPTDVLRMDGSPGPAVLAEVDAPGSVEVELQPDATYTLLIVRADGGGTATTAEPTVTSPSGSRTSVTRPDVDLTVTMGSHHAEAIASFRTQDGGPYRIDAPATLDGRPASLYLVESDGFGAFMGGLFGSIAGVLGAVFLGVTATILLIIGGIMWGVRRGNARQQATLSHP